MKVYHRPPERSIGFAMPNYLETTYQSNFERFAAPPPCAAAVPSVTPPEQPGVERNAEADDDAAANS